MKQLQNNFTSPEQSKRLLELGVPADSADCFYYSDNQGEEVFPNIIPIVNDGKICFSLFCDNKALPCWSVGRLIEIMKICSMPVMTWYIKSNSKQSLIELFMENLETSILERDFDFSKLED